MNAEQPYTIAEVAELLRVSTWTVGAMTRDGRLARVPGIRRTRIPRWSVDQLLAGGYDAPHAEPDRQASREAPAPRRGHRDQAARPLARQAVGRGGAIPGR